MKSELWKIANLLKPLSLSGSILLLESDQYFLINYSFPKETLMKNNVSDISLELIKQSNILIVDDEPINLKVFEYYLSEDNYSVTSAKDGFEALEYIESKEKFDLVLLDVMMPDMTGYQVCKKIREKYLENELPVILVTAKNQLEDLLEGFESGANDYLKKPFSQEELLARVKVHLRVKELIAKNMRLETELNVARKLQQMVLPSKEEIREIKTLDIAGLMAPATEVGGDYFDILKHKGLIKIGIGDVSGHGLESGILMLMTQSIIRALLTHGETDPVKFFNTINTTICKNAKRMLMDNSITLALLDYIPPEKGNKNGIIKVSGQHEQVIVVRKVGKIELIDTDELGFPIALDSSLDITKFIKQTSIILSPGDGIVLFSDGFTEAINTNEEMYGMERLCDIISRSWNNKAEKIKEAVLEDLRKFIGEEEQYDDLTLVVLKQK